MALELGVPLADVGAALEGFAGAFGRVETIRIGPAVSCSILLVKNPAGANEVLRTLTLEDGRLDLWLALNDRHRRRPRRLLGLGRRLRAARRTRAPRHLLGNARRGDGAAAEVRGHRRRAEVERDLGASLDAALAARRQRGACSLCPPTRRCWSCATCWSRRGHAAAVVRVRSGPVAWHDVECSSYAADLPLWRELAEQRPRAAARPRRGHRPGGAGPGARRATR